MAITWTDLVSSGGTGGGTYWYARVLNDGDFPKRFCMTTRLLPSDNDQVTNRHVFNPDGESYSDVIANIGSASSLLTRISYGEPESGWPPVPGSADGTLFWDTSGFGDPRVSRQDNGVVVVKREKVGAASGIQPIPSAMQTDLSGFYFPTPTHAYLGVGIPSQVQDFMSTAATGRSDICHLRCCDPYAEVLRPVDLTGTTPSFINHNQLIDTPTGRVRAAFALEDSIFEPAKLPTILSYFLYYDPDNGDAYIVCDGRSDMQLGNIKGQTQIAGAHSMFGFPPQIQIGAYGREQTAGAIGQTITAVVKTYRGSTLVDSATIFTGQAMTDAGASIFSGYRVTRYGPTYHDFPATLSAEGTTAWSLELSGNAGGNNGVMDGIAWFKQPCRNFPHAMSDWPLPAGGFIPGRCFKMP